MNATHLQLVDAQREGTPMTAPTGDVKTELALVNQKLDFLIEQTNVRGADHEQRLRSLEQFKWLVLGASAGIGGLSGWLANVVTK